MWQRNKISESIVIVDIKHRDIDKSIKTPPFEDEPALGGASAKTSGPPDGGLHAWLAVLGCCLVLFNCWGLVQAFGAFQSYYTVEILRSYDASAISWIGAVQSFLLPVVGVVTGPIFDQGYLRTLLVLGSCVMVFGIMMLSLSTEYYQIILSQGICLGFGSGVLFTPAIAQVTVLFDKHRALALALATAGVGLGGIVYPIIFDQLEPRIGFGWTTRVIGFVALATLAMATTALSWKKTVKKPPRALFDWSALKEPEFITYNFAVFFMFTSYWVPWFYIPLFARFGAGASASLSFYLLSITNATTIFGRLMTPILQRWFNPMHLMFGATLLAGTLIWSWISISELPNFITFCIFWGLIAGTMAVLPASGVAMLSPSINVVGARMGMVWATSAVGVLIGSPIAGAVSDPRENDFLGGQIYAGVCMLVACAFYVLTLLFLRRRKRAA